MAEQIKILVAEHDAEARTELSSNLESAGYAVVEAVDGAEALKLFRSENPDLVVLDTAIAGISGFEVCRRIKHEKAAVPVIIATSKDDVAGRFEGFQVGADDYITKPYNMRELNSRIKVMRRLSHPWFAFENKEKPADAEGEALVESLEEMVLSISRMAEFRLNSSPRHIERMSRYTAFLAGKAGFSKAPHEVRLASMMHDIGKLFVPERILMKPGALTNKEFATIRQHAARGGGVLERSELDLVGLAASIAFNHHEKFDGSGYPCGLAGEAIPIEGRIAAITDVFDALTSVRSYGTAKPVDDAVHLMLEEKEKHFDPELLDLFINSMDDIIDIRNNNPDL